MKKGIAIQTILLILVGVLVVGVLVYLLYVYATGSSLSASKCKSELTTICTLCSIRSFAGSMSTEQQEIVAACDDLQEFGFFSGVTTCSMETQCGMIGVNATI